MGFALGVASGSKQDNIIITVCHLISSLLIFCSAYMLYRAERKQDTNHVVLTVSLVYMLISSSQQRRISLVLKPSITSFIFFQVSHIHIDIHSMIILPPIYILTPTCTS